jgi:very-short-patch-repair endonuclease
VIKLLCRLAHAKSEVGSATGADSGDAYAALYRLCGSGLERSWLETVKTDGLRLPDRAQPMFSEFSTQPDFSYDGTKALIYVDGPHHQNATTKTMDDAKRRTLREAGYKVIVFNEDPAGWPDQFAKFAFVFGKGKA